MLLVSPETKPSIAPSSLSGTSLILFDVIAFSVPSLLIILEIGTVLFVTIPASRSNKFILSENSCLLACARACKTDNISCCSEVNASDASNCLMASCMSIEITSYIVRARNSVNSANPIYSKRIFRQREFVFSITDVLRKCRRRCTKQGTMRLVGDLSAGAVLPRPLPAHPRRAQRAAPGGRCSSWRRGCSARSNAAESTSWAGWHSTSARRPTLGWATTPATGSSPGPASFTRYDAVQKGSVTRAYANGGKGWFPAGPLLDGGRKKRKSSRRVLPTQCGRSEGPLAGYSVWHSPMAGAGENARHPDRRCKNLKLKISGCRTAYRRPKNVRAEGSA